MGSKWRAPKKNNKQAWRKIEQGDYLWEGYEVPDCYNPAAILERIRRQNPKYKRSNFGKV